MHVYFDRPCEDEVLQTVQVKAGRLIKMTRILWSGLTFFTITQVVISDHSYEEWQSQGLKYAEKKPKKSKKTLSRTVRPCDDFYEYVCSGWEQANEIPSDRTTYGQFEDVEEKLFKDLREILGEIPLCEDCEQTATHKLGIAYSSCVAN
ncbi:hypothetical protein MTO96_044195, partial [Rhipicephalus appendiculatus]